MDGCVCPGGSSTVGAGWGGMQSVLSPPPPPPRRLPFPSRAWLRSCLPVGLDRFIETATTMRSVRVCVKAGGGSECGSQANQILPIRNYASLCETTRRRRRRKEGGGRDEEEEEEGGGGGEEGGGRSEGGGGAVPVAAARAASGCGCGCREFVHVCVRM
eukprot:GHVU01072055.1.p1 GENE.GHVU01072055.1~~GHVU01072055.1.p1  ORF type:complete len:159 (-),score=39.77 GHVU01072055.1:200-676(-)